MPAMPQMSSRILSTQMGSWQIVADEMILQYHDVLPPGDNEVNKWAEVASELDAFIIPVYLGPTLHSAAFFPQEKKIYLGSRNFHREVWPVEHLPADQLESGLHDFVEKVRSVKQHQGPGQHELVSLRSKLADLDAVDLSEVYQKAQIWYDRLQKRMRHHRSTWFEDFSDELLALTAQFGLLRIHLLKFLALLPSLDHDREGNEVKRLLIEALRRLLADNLEATERGFSGERSPLPWYLAHPLKWTKFIAELVPAPLLAEIVRAAVRFQAKRFIAGESIAHATESLGQLRDSGREATLDQLGELVVSQAEADGYCDKVCELISGLKEHIRPGTLNRSGILCAHVSIKVSALCPDFRPQAFDYVYSQIAPRLRKILLLARQEQVFINVDAEHYHYRDAVLAIYRKVLLDTPALKYWAHTGIVLQAYLRDGAQHFNDILNLARERGVRMPVRLVKGAYWDAETIEARAHHFPAPQFLNKEETDIHFRQLTIKMLENHRFITLCLASHNLSDHSFAEAYRQVKFPLALPIEHQCLHMTYEALSVAMAKESLVVRNYVPVGSLLVGMAYLVRRIMENSSQVGILAAMRAQKMEKYLSRPEKIYQKNKLQGALSRDHLEFIDTGFQNATPLRLYRSNEWESFHNEFQNARVRLSMEMSQGSYPVYSPSLPDAVIGKINLTPIYEVPSKVESLRQAHIKGEWRMIGPVARAAVMIKAAEKLLLERNAWASLITLESGKAFIEALADVDEAIDFLNFYARQEVKINYKGKRAPRGPFAIICPWNFPLAIPMGMAVGALVTGNPVALKSAEQTPLISQKLVELLHWAGVPQDVLIHFPGDGEIGKALVENSAIAGIIFTGSKAVGTAIFKSAQNRLYHDPVSHLHFPVKVVTEMGGKNAIIVTANAELDETVNGALYSAFGHAGQKCSAASRILVHESLLDKFTTRFASAVKDLKVAEADNPASYINPIISAEDQQRLRSQIREAGLEAESYLGKILVDRSQELTPGYCVGPAVFVLPAERALHPESYARRELFGPVVHVIPFKDLNHAVELFNGVEYGLTGGIFSQSQDDIEFLSSRLMAGNLYINRGCTGARVGIEPFGGFKHSGTGPKAGGIHYLDSFYAPLFESNDDVAPIVASVPPRSLPFPLPLTWEVGLRTQLVLKALARIAQRDRDLFSTKHNVHLINHFRRWFDVHKDKWLAHSHPNVKIPGQMSYDDYSQVRKRGVIVSLGNSPHLSSLFYLTGALYCGAGVTIWCQGVKGHESWTRLVEEFRVLGLPSSALDVALASPEQIDQSLKNPELDFMIIDGPDIAAQKWVASFLSVDRIHMGQVLSSQVCDLFHQEAFIYPFVLTRSFATNIMRHGAPMELEAT